MVEFALVLPLLMVLLLGIADFGRVFSAGISMEAATRNAAESAAQQYVQIMRAKGYLDDSDYAALHSLALAELCREASVLPSYSGSGGSCSMPIAAVCVHDPVTSPPVTYGPDPDCGGGAASLPLECPGLASPAWSATNAQGGADSLGYIEVRSCYRFTTLFNLQNLQLPFATGLSIGDIYLQRARTFSVACYYGSSCR